ncbi:DUF4148 domain-containing protein [Paraburkholderia antibiotica]|uniref:DUF4148 domain-containing protein n=1 Tax=Paraburkholderia antibiotica TaxID=2728839 RepID=A0A7X9X2Z9_9BURK|nr:DUF4148 domain-containing protein [Paraburkholderia antibiotica]NML30509.1 DUF4148 domain-containing protein [Paraburkholderia antibiotica]
MKSIALLILASAMALSSTAYAQGLTRADVKQQLIEAKANGLDYVTDTSYPDMHPSFAHKFMVKVKAPAQQAEASNAPEKAPTQQAAEAPNRNPMPHGNPHCVGPVSFCNIYAGS